jgi:hypothetical protein
MNVNRTPETGTRKPETQNDGRAIVSFGFQLPASGGLWTFCS